MGQVRGLAGVVPTVGLRGAVLGRVRGPGGGVPPHVPRLGGGGRGLETAQEAPQKEHGGGGRH